MLQDISPQFLCETGRAKKLERLGRYFDGTQYEGMPDWFADTANVPARERAPCVVYPLPKASVNQAVRFAIGEGKFPRLRVDALTAEDAMAPALAVTLDESKILVLCAEDLVRTSRLRSVLRTAMRRGLSVGTAVLTMSVRDGRFCFEHPHARHCIPTFENDSPECDVTSLVWVYEYEQVERDDTGHPTTKRYFFRRDYDAVEVIEYGPGTIDASTGLVRWIEKSREAHGLGFCPVQWTRNLPDECGSDIDGVSLYDGLLDELDALNYTLSKRHAGIDILGTPQPYETGVEEGDGPGAVGRPAAPSPTNQRAAAGYTPRSAPRRQGSRKAGADHLWSYEGTEVKLGLIETTGKAFEVATAHVLDVRDRLLEAMDVILIDHSKVVGKGDMSAKALALMYAPLLALVDELREWWWEHCINPVLNMMLRASAKLGAGILVKGAKRLTTLLAKRTVIIDGEPIWVAPEITPAWGEYFSPSPQDIQQTVLATQGAKDAGLIATSTAIRYIAPNFNVADVDAESETIATESAEKQAQALEMMKAAPPQSNTFGKPAQPAKPKQPKPPESQDT